MWGEGWSGEELGSDGNGEKAEYWEGLMEATPTIPTSAMPPTILLPERSVPLPWIPLFRWRELVLAWLPVAMEEGASDWREKAQDLAGFMSVRWVMGEVWGG